MNNDDDDNAHHWLFFVAVIFMFLVVAFTSGCASFTSPTNEVRVTEYQGGVEGGYPGYGVGGNITIKGGCRLVIEGVTSGCLKYTGDDCNYTSSACNTEQPDPLNPWEW